MQANTIGRQLYGMANIYYVPLDIYQSSFACIISCNRNSCLHIKEEVREDLYMQAGLQVPFCCRPATYDISKHHMHVWTEQLL
jgi:hypothetical protein